ncbi:hypothetical protein Clacol_000638 [Clathrus columnatus]|uniref:adenosylmethionine decarboxylase n=1 Tax=Clathrus columnatus TaxID=1419009 RepID=A0AAV5A093_9AGAM|nr:hypothetical protein Clacol_000638 [Clathrus columnatus]
MLDIDSIPQLIPVVNDTETLSNDVYGNNVCPFEGPEKLLEIWFAPNPDILKHSNTPNRTVWEEMLDIVKCKVLNVIRGDQVDAYLLSESSLFVFPHKLILKTCGTTLNLLGLPRILEIASVYCGLNAVYRCFYSRKSFMFPDRQQGPHREWRNEVEYLDNIFGPGRGAAYTVGKVNGDHWQLYLTNTTDDSDRSSNSEGESTHENEPHNPKTEIDQDYTLEILMTKLSPDARSAFYFDQDNISEDAPSQGRSLSAKLGIEALFPISMSTLDSFAFMPCGYSANALVRHGKNQEGYYTIHVTPEEGWSYASFECNIPVSHHRKPDGCYPDLRTLIQRVVRIFQPGHLSLTLFMTSSDDNEAFDEQRLSNACANGHENGHVNGINGKANGNIRDWSTQGSVDCAQKAFRDALVPQGYKRTDKINYEFGGYDLAFASFEFL